jgi:cell division protein FtsL
MKGQRVHIPPTLRAAVACLLISAFTITALGVGHVAKRQRVIRLGYELTDAITELRRLEEENRRLRLERSVLTNPARIERLARAVGMLRPAPGQIRVVGTAAAEVAAVHPNSSAEVPARPPGHDARRAP